MASSRATNTFIEVARFFVVLLTTGLGYRLGRSEPAWLPDLLRDPGSATLVLSLLGAAVGYVVGGAVGRYLQHALGVVEDRVDRTPTAQVMSGAVGALIGVAAGILVTLPVLVLVPAIWAVPLGAFATWLLGSSGYRIARRKSADLLRMMGLSAGFAPRDGYPPHRDVAGVLVDSSAIIDGRLLAVSRAGFLEEPLLVTQFVLEEVQAIADSGDRKRRRRGRRGLEVLDVLRAEAEVVVIEDSLPEVEEVDAKLVRLALRLSVPLLTTDFALQKVAELQGIEVRNVNRLVEAVRPPVVPGDHMRIKIEVEGTQEQQGVGYTDDGTMVVVSDAQGSIGLVVEAIVTSAHQTSAGRMLFARRSEDPDPSPASVDA